MIRPLNILFLIADAGHARLVSLSRETGDYRTLVERHSGRPPRKGEPVAVFQSFGHGRHTTQPHGGGAERSEAEFLDDIAAEAADLAGKGGFYGLALVAPARVLSALRERVPANMLAGELAKDLTKVRDHDLAAWLRDVRPATAS